MPVALFGKLTDVMRLEVHTGKYRDGGFMESDAV
jgi:hypothetical protein